MFKLYIDSTESEFNIFLKKYGMYLAIGVAILVAIALIIVLVVHFSKKNSKVQEPIMNNDKVLLALGGKENILEYSYVGSRLSLKLNNYDVVDNIKLNELGFPSVIKMSNKITLVYEGDLESLVKKLFA